MIKIVPLLLIFCTGLAVAGSSLQPQLEQIASQHRGGLSLYAEDVKTGRSVAVDADRKVPTASVIKLCVLLEALQQVRTGKVRFEDRLALKKEDQVPGSGVLLFFDTPLEITLKDALKMMIIMSDNTATNLVIDRIGFANINQRIEALGLKNTYLFNKVFAHTAQPLPADKDGDHKKFGFGVTTAREMASVMKKLAVCEPADPLCQETLTMLGDQFYRESIPRFLDEWIAPGSGTGVAVGNKSGSLDAVRNDVALVAGKRGPIIISAFTYDNQDHSWQADNEAELTIAKLAKAIVAAWSPEGVAPDRYNKQP